MPRRSDIRTPLATAVVAGVMLAPATMASVSGHRGKVHRISKAQRKHFKVLRHARTSADSLPSDLRAIALDDPLGALYGINLGLTREAIGATDGPAALSGIWVAPGNNAICLYVAFADDSEGVGSGNCSSSMSRASAGRLVATLGGLSDLPAGSERVMGLLPDGVQKASIVSRDGDATNLLIHNNVYTAVVSHPDHVRFTDASGDSHSVDVP
jgi:hypothetical protein